MAAPQPTLTRLAARRGTGRREAAYPRSSKCLSAATSGPPKEFPFTETLAAPRGCATTHHIGLCPIRRCRAVMRCVISAEARENRAKIRAFQVIFDARSHVVAFPGKRYRTAKIRRRAAGAPQGRRHAGARQGQIHRRFHPARPGLCLDGALQPRPRHHPGHRHRGRQGDAGRARRLDRQGPGSRRLQPLHLRPAAEEPRRLAAAADQPPGAADRQGALRRRSRRLRGRRNAGAGARCRPRPSNSTSSRCRP